MVETESTQFDGKHCPDCLKELESSLVEKAFDPDINAFCPFCGNLLEFTKDDAEDASSPPEAVNKDSTTPVPPERTFDRRMLLKIHVHLLVHEFLYTKIVPMFKLPRNKPLSTLNLRLYARHLRSKLLKDPLHSRVTSTLTPRERKSLARALGDFKTLIHDKKAYKQFHRVTFMEGIEFMYEVMRGSYEFADLSSTEQQLVIALKEQLHSFMDLKARDTTYRVLTILFARFIHQRLFAILRVSEGGQLPSNTIKDLVDELVERLQIKGFAKWLEARVRVHVLKRERKMLQRVRYRLRLDWVQRENMSDHLTNIAHVVYTLLVSDDVKFTKKGLARIILHDLAESELFRFDPSFTANEKLNLTIVFARMIRARLDATYPPIEDKSTTQVLSKTLKREIAKEMVLGLSSEQPIAPDFLKSFYNFSLDQYHAALHKLREKLTMDPIYRASFRQFISSLIETTFKLTRACPKKSKLAPIEMRIREDLELYPYDWRRTDPDLFIQQEKEESLDTINNKTTRDDGNDQGEKPELEKIPELPERLSEAKKEFQDIFTREILDDDPLWRVRAYIIGFLLADGSIFTYEKTNSYQIYASQHERDKDIIEIVQKALGGNITGPNSKKRYRLEFSNKEIYIKLKEYGMCEKHTHTEVAINLLPPSFIKMKINGITIVRDFVRGFFDGDGSFGGTYKDYSLRYQILGPNNFLKELKDLIVSEIDDFSCFIAPRREDIFIEGENEYHIYSKGRIYIKGKGYRKLTNEEINGGNVYRRDHPWLCSLHIAGAFNCIKFFNWLYCHDDKFDAIAIQGIPISGKRKYHKSLKALGNSEKRKTKLAPNWKETMIDMALNLKSQFYDSKSLMERDNEILYNKLKKSRLEKLYDEKKCNDVDYFNFRLKYLEYRDKFVGHFRRKEGGYYKNYYYSKINPPNQFPAEFHRYIDLINKDETPKKNIKNYIVYIFLNDNSWKDFSEIHSCISQSKQFAKIIAPVRIEMYLLELESFDIIITEKENYNLDTQRFRLGISALSKYYNDSLEGIKNKMSDLFNSKK